MAEVAFACAAAGSAAEAVLGRPELLSLVLASPSLGDGDLAALGACACVCKAWTAAAGGSDGLWRAALLRRFPATPTLFHPAPLPAGPDLRRLVKRRCAKSWCGQGGTGGK